MGPHGWKKGVGGRLEVSPRSMSGTMNDTTQCGKIVAQSPRCHLFLTDNILILGLVYPSVPDSLSSPTDISVHRGEIAGRSSYPHSLVWMRHLGIFKKMWLLLLVVWKCG